MRYVFPLEGRTRCQPANSLSNGNATFGGSIGERDESVGGRHTPAELCFQECGKGTVSRSAAEGPPSESPVFSRLQRKRSFAKECMGRA